MKVKYLSALLATVFSVTVFAVQSSSEIFKKTINRVDYGGDFLQYMNVTPTMQKLNKLPDFIGDLLTAFDIQDAATAKEVTGIIVKTLNFQTVKGIALSSREVAPESYLLKQFVYLGNDINTPSAFSMVPKNNSAIKWQDLPADTIIAFDSKILPGEFFKLLKTNLAESNDPQVKGVALLIDQLAMSGIDMQTITDSVESISLTISGRDPDTFGISFSITDNNGSITAKLAKIFPRHPGQNTVNIPIPSAPFPGIAPALFYGEKSLTFVSHPRLLNAPEKKLGDLPEFKKFASLLQSSGTGFMIINIDRELISNSLSYMSKAISDSTFAQKYCLTPIRLFAVDSTLPDGFMLSVASNFSIPQIAMEIPVLVQSAIIIPALSSARSRARSVSCMNNLKLLGTGLMMYADDHSNTLPAPNGKAGLEKLLPDYIDKKAFVCPADNSGEYYIYTGGALNIAKLQTPSRYPVAFDPPGLHKNNVVNVLFADGHVSTLSIKNYSDPAQVIGELNKQFHYPPEVMDVLLKAVAENK